MTITTRSLIRAAGVSAAAAGTIFLGVQKLQRRRVGILGLVGYLLFAAGYLLMSSVEAIAAFVLPTLAHSSRVMSPMFCAPPPARAPRVTSARCRRCSASSASCT
jgi:hypothetical protein